MSNRSYLYINGSRNLDWKGILIENFENIQNINDEVHFDDFFFSMALEDFSIIINGKNVEVMKNDMFITPQKQVFHLNSKQAYKALMMTFSFDFLKDHFYDHSLNQLTFLSNYQIRDNNMSSLIKLIHEQALSETQFDDIYLNQLLSTFVTYYVLNYSNYTKKENEHTLTHDCFLRIDKYIDDNLSNDVTYKDISTLSGMSNYSFLSEFKEITKTTPHQYILNRKLEKSKKLLKNNSLTITDISYELGFTDSSHFSKFFKKYVNMSPSQYRNKSL